MKYIYLLIIVLLFSVRGLAQLTCATPMNVTYSIYTVSAINGTQIPPTACASNGMTNVTAANWYKFTPTTNTTVKVSTLLAQNVGKDTRFHVFTGTCAALTCLTGNDDFGDTLLSEATFAVNAGTTYYIVFDNRWSSVGFDFQISEYIVNNRVTFSPVTIGVSGSYHNCVVDMNGDYLDDVVSVVSNSQLKINYQNATTGFTGTTITLPSSVSYMPGWSIAAGDFNNDGFNDLLYGSGSGVSFLRSNSSGTNYDVVQQSQYVFSQRSNFTDINDDGKLDAFVCHDVQPNVYYINNGAGSFTYYQGGMGDVSNGGNYGSIFVDYDNDGDSDLFIAKCRGGATEAKYNELHRNNGNGTFTNVSVESNLRDPVQTWSSAWGDFNNDGYFDALVGANSTADGVHKLMKNNGNGTFSDITAGSGWQSFISYGREFFSFDFDNDGYIDVASANGNIMYNNGDFTFTANSVLPSYLGGVGDLNHDGFLDMQDGGNGTLYMNNGNTNKWIIITLRGIQSNRNGIGARVEIYGPWGKQIREVQSGIGFEYMHTLNTHFGLGTATNITKVVVRWPSGIIDEFNNIAPNQYFNIIEGSSLGIDDINEQSTFSIYPNPVKNIITLSDNTFSQAEIFDLSGKLIQSVAIINQQINVQNLPKGNYILQVINSKNEKMVKKFIKN